MGVLLGENDNIFTRMDAFHESWSLQTLLRAQNTANLSSVQVEDIKLPVDDKQVVTPNVPISAVQPELVSKEPFEAVGPVFNRKADTPKKESATEKAKKHKTMTHNARRRIGGMNLTRGYTKMPKDRAEYDFRRGVYVPTIKLKDLEELKTFDFEFPPEKREHGFMISFQDQTLYWNKDKQDFQPEIIKIKI